MNYQWWEVTVPRDITDDVLWTVDLVIIPQQRSKSTSDAQTKYLLDNNEKDAIHPSQTHSFLEGIPIP